VLLGQKIFDFVPGGFANSVSCELLLTRFEEFLAPAIVEIGGYPLAAAQFGNALFAAQTLEDDPDLLLRSKLPAGATTDLSHC
jgi:hypothetical protein